MRIVSQIFGILVAAPLFVGLTWFFGIYMSPQGDTGAGFAAVLILVSALASLWVYRWIVRPGPKVRFRNRGVEGFDRDYGMGLTGYAQSKSRRRDESDGEDLGGRRSSGDLDDDLGEDGSFA